MENKKIFLVLLSFILFQLALGQEYNYAFRIDFTDKNNTKYSISKPQTFLSDAAIARRLKLGITISENDFPVNSWYVDSIVKLGGVYHNSSRWLNSAVFFSNAIDFPDQVSGLSFVSGVTIVYINESRKQSNLTDKFTIENHDSVPTDIEYGDAYDQINLCNAQFLHNQGFWGQGMKIAVIDGGFYRADEVECLKPLFKRGGILGTYDFVKNETNVYDDIQHGTSVLSLMAADLEDKLLGTAKEASFWLLRSEDANTEYPIEEENWITAAEWADSAGCNIITSSLGYCTFNANYLDHSYSDMDGKTARSTLGAEAAFARGIFVVVAAGNEGSNNWYYITAPSDGEHVLCVGATDKSGNIAYFSSRGPSYDGRIKPDVCAMGKNTFVANSPTLISKGNGTSYACPLIAGMAACLWQARPNLSNIQLLDYIRNSAQQSNNPDYTYGYGLADMAQALMDIDSVKYHDFCNLNIIGINPTLVMDETTCEFYTPIGETVNLTIYNNLGVEVYRMEQQTMPTSYNSLKINGLKRFPKGLYHLNLKVGNYQKQQSFIRI
jgi:serine protease AprX